MRVLFLDDNRDRHSTFRQNAIGCSVDQVYTAQEAIDALSNEDVQYDAIFLDHDLNWETENQLNDEEEDGRTVARHLATIERYTNTTVIVHSLNQAGGMLMKGILEDGGFTGAYYYPFAWKHWKKNEDGNWVVDPN